MNRPKTARSLFADSPDFVRNVALFVDNHFEMGDFYHVPLPFFRVFVVTGPAVAQHVLVHEELKYEKSRIYWHQLRAIVGDALATAEGEEWVALKRMQMPFYTPSAVANHLPQVARLTDFFQKKWVEDGQAQAGFDVVHHFAEMNVAILLKTVFGTEADVDCAEMARFIAAGEDIIVWRSKFPWRPFLSKINGKARKTAQYAAFFDAFVARAIDHFEKNKGPRDTLFARLIEQMTVTEGQKLTTKDIRNEFITHLGAGTETMAVAESWTLLLLTQNPEYQQMIRHEIEVVTGGGPLRSEHLPRLQLTERVVKESLRLYPPSQGIVRDCVAKTGDEIEGVPIKKGDTIFVSAWGLHRNPRLWDAPAEFRPDRFLGEEKFPKYAYIPWGIGRHKCIGRFLAMPQLVLAIAGFCRRFDFQRVDNQAIRPVSLSTMKPGPPLKLNIFPR